MHLPLGYTCPLNHVYRLWPQTGSSGMTVRSSFDEHHVSSLHPTPIYVDDMIISGNDTKGIKDLNGHLMHSFKMKDLKHLTYFLGLEISRSNEGICIICNHQRKYVEILLASAHHSDRKTTNP